MNLIGNNTSDYLKGNKRRKKSILPFIVLSILFHLLLVLVYLLFYPPDRQAVKPKEKPEFIEITQVPVPKEKETEPPEETKRLAERSHQSPEEKTKDDFTKEGAVSALPQPKQPGQTKKTEEKTQPSKQSKEVKTAKKEPKKEVSTDKSRQVASIPKVEKDSELTRKQLEERKTPDLSKEDLFSAVPRRQPSQQQQASQEFLGARNIEKKEDTVDFNTTEFKYISYFNKLKRQIEGVWNYPELSRLRGEQGELFLIFTIRRDGQLEDVKLINSSGYARLDNEAIRAIDVAAPFPPFPSQWGSLERLNVRAVFRYQISYGWQIR